jgi:transcriptional regulator with GAF, ATPase, and Fis domain
MTERLPRIGADLLSVAACELQSAGDANEVLERVAANAVATIEPCDYAGITVDHHGQPRTLAATDPTVLEIDELQYAGDTGPCLEAMRGGEPAVYARDLAQDLRWGHFGREASARGVHAVLAHQLYVGSERLGSLNLYGATPKSFTRDDHEQASVLSALASLAINALRHATDAGGLREALKTRDLNGQAKGILMEREGIDEQAAFDRLRVSSQRQNVKLREIAQRVVDTRDVHVKI